MSLFFRGNLEASPIKLPQSSPLYTSPDILPYGSTAPGDLPDGVSYEEYFSTSSSMATAPPSQNQIVPGTTNYIYVRGQAPGGGFDGRVYLYYSQPSLTLNPGDWTQIPPNQGQPVTVGADGIGVVYFEWQNPPPSDSGHHCLFCSTVPQNDLNASELSDGIYGQRNINYVATGTNPVTTSYIYDSQGQDGYITTNWKNLPPGSTVKLSGTGITSDPWTVGSTGTGSGRTNNVGGASGQRTVTSTVGVGSDGWQPDYELVVQFNFSTGATRALVEPTAMATAYGVLGTSG